MPSAKKHYLCFPMSETACSFSNLAIGYSARRPLLSDLAAGLLCGSLTCLLGVNGSGKSTLLRTLAGLQPPLGGSVQVMGKTLKSFSAGERARTVGIVLTDRIPSANLTVWELAAMGRMPYTGFLGTLSGEDREQTALALRTVGMEKFASRPIGRLSDGERQKVLIAKALAQKTPVIMLDEPTNFLDYPSKQEVFALLKRLAHENDLAVLVSTHDLEIALQAGDCFWTLNEGSLTVDGGQKARQLFGLNPIKKEEYR